MSNTTRRTAIWAAILVCVLLAAAALFSSRGSALPRPGSAKYDQYTTEFQKGVAAVDADVPHIAEPSLGAAIEIVSGEPAAWADRALVKIRDGRLDEALGDLQQAAQLAPRSAQIQALLGIAEQKRGRLAAAQTALQTAVEIDPHNAANLYRLAEVVDAQHLPTSDAQYAELLDKILQLQPDNLFVLQSALRAKLRQGDRDGALATLATLKKLSTHWSDDAKEALGDAEQALADPKAKLDAAAALPLVNMLRGEPRYAHDAAAVAANGSLSDLAVEHFLVLESPQYKPAPADMRIQFARKTWTPPPGAWTAARSVALSKDATAESLVFANDSALSVDGQQIPIGVPVSQRGLVALDWNNDFRIDFLLAGNKGLAFFEQDEHGQFHDVRGRTSLPDTVLNDDYIAAWGMDIDADGDLDLVAARRSGEPVLLQNNFDGTWTAKPIFAGVNGAVALAWLDLNNDGLPDAALLDASGKLHVFSNERSGKFERWPVAPPDATFLDLAVASLDAGKLPSLVALQSDGAIVELAPDSEHSKWQSRELARAPSFPEQLKPGEATLIVADFDNNGAQDLLVSALADGWLWLAENGAGGHSRFVRYRPQAPGHLVAISNDPATFHFVAASNDLATGRVGVIGLDDNGKPFVLTSTGAADYRWQNIRCAAREVKGDNRINSFGIGGSIAVRNGTFFASQMIESPITHIGLGAQSQADVIRIEWPNGTSQIEFSPPVDKLFEAQQRLKGSCPFLFAWNGERFDFVADFMWSTPLGMYINAQNDGQLGRTTEWVKIAGDRLRPRDGIYELRVNANLWETHYFDSLGLMVVDHPADTELFVDERFSPTMPAPLMYVTTEPQPVAHAGDQHGADVTEIVSTVDGKYLDHFERGVYQGIAEEHWVEFELPEKTPGDGPLLLLATGWIHPTDSSVNFALEQGHRTRPYPLVLEVADGAGGWTIVDKNLGFPAGKNKTMVIPLEIVEAAAGGSPRRIRLRTNMEIYWDALRVARGVDLKNAHAATLAADSAELRSRGIIEMTQADPSSPELPHYDRLVAHGQWWRDLTGYYTRFGDIRELLEKIDDRYAILTAGDEIAMRFKAPADPPAGWKRDFVWISDGWVKDGDYNTRFGNTVLPLPSHSATSYNTPPGRLQDDPVYRQHAADWQTYHTRYVAPDDDHGDLRGAQR